MRDGKLNCGFSWLSLEEELEVFLTDGRTSSILTVSSNWMEGARPDSLREF